jgi:ribonucleotide monophosphatase NagD (HAD superfamily)
VTCRSGSTEIVNTVVTMTRWLLEHAPDAVVYPISEPPLIRALERAGIRMSDDPAEIDIVIASYDRTFTYAKLQIAFDAIFFHKRARLVATNPDRFCPSPAGAASPTAPPSSPPSRPAREPGARPTPASPTRPCSTPPWPASTSARPTA